MGRRIKKIASRGFSDLMIAQFLLAILLYIMVAFYESNRPLALGLGFIFVVGMLFFSTRGFYQLWKKKSKRQ